VGSDVEQGPAAPGRQPGEDHPSVFLLGGPEDSLQVAPERTQWSLRA
jgi:hypothetical protein